ncbi:MAG: hypothetical protein KH268_07795 [Clostridiales bacterium]|nr:hypothetical protein [Clostridiales bacterium]
MFKEERSTDMVLEDLKNEEEDFFDKIKEDFVEGKFPIEMSAFIESKGMTPSKLSTYCSVCKSYINQLLQVPEPGKRYDKHPNKYVVVEMCMYLGATLEETNRFLKLAGCQELYAKNAADSIIIRGLWRKMSAEEIKEKLCDKGLNNIFK